MNVNFIIKEAKKKALARHGKIKPLNNDWLKSYTINDGYFILWYLDRYGSSHIVKELLSDWTTDNTKQIKMIILLSHHLSNMYERYVTTEEASVYYCKNLAKYFKHGGYKC